jgi:hypothetical protein
MLEESRLAVPPMRAAVQRVVEPAVIEPHPAVVLAGDDVVRVQRVDRNLLLGLPTERAVLIGAWIRGRSAVRTAERAHPDVGGIVSRAARLCVGGFRTLFFEDDLHPAREVRQRLAVRQRSVLGACEQRAAARRSGGHDDQRDNGHREDPGRRKRAHEGAPSLL